MTFRHDNSNILQAYIHLKAKKCSSEPDKKINVNYAGKYYLILENVFS